MGCAVGAGWSVRGRVARFLVGDGVGALLCKRSSIFAATWIFLN